MSKLPILSGSELIKILSKVGYQVIRKRGSHFRLSCSRKKSVTVPDYKTISHGLLRKILRDAELSLKEFLSLI